MQVIEVLCNTGLGSGLFIEMNIREILERHGLDDRFETKHGALYDVDWLAISFAVVVRDLAPFVNAPPSCKLIVLDSVVDADELERKLLAELK